MDKQPITYEELQQQLALLKKDYELRRADLIALYQKRPISDALRQTVYRVAQYFDFDLEQLYQDEVLRTSIDNMIRAWDWYTSLGMDFGSAWLRVWREVTEIINQR